MVEKSSKIASQIIDSHCHINLIEQSHQKIAIKNAIESGVSIMQNICTKISEIDEIIAIANQHDSIYASVGTHPNNTEDEPNIIASDIISICEKYPQKIIGIGETGLDYYYENSNRDIQKRQFTEHIKASQHTKKPIIVHTRAADDDTVGILSDMLKISHFPILIHCFTGDLPFLTKLLDLGCTISYSGIVTFKNAKNVFESMMHTPIDRMLIETDSPYLAPVPMRGKQNEPAFVRYVSEFIATHKQINPDEFAQIINQNFYNLFSV